VKESKEELRRRIGALADADLVRMLTLEADERPVPELLAARAEARARNLGPEARGDEPQATLPPPAVEPSPSLAMTAPLDTRRLASLWPWALIVPAGVAIEAWVVLQDRQGSPEARLVLLCGSLTGFAFYLHAVHRLHALLKQATGGRYPITPGAALGMHFVPLYGFYWPFHWGNQLSHFTKLNGRGRPFVGYAPGALFLAAYGAGYYDGSLRLLLLFATVWCLRYSFSRSMAHQQAEEAQTGDWSSSAKS
jgi:hypothetical protein